MLLRAPDDGDDAARRRRVRAPVAPPARSVTRREAVFRAAAVPLELLGKNTWLWSLLSLLTFDTVRGSYPNAVTIRISRLVRAFEERCEKVDSCSAIRILSAAPPPAPGSTQRRPRLRTLRPLARHPRATGEAGQRREHRRNMGRNPKKAGKKAKAKNKGIGQYDKRQG